MKPIVQRINEDLSTLDLMNRSVEQVADKYLFDLLYEILVPIKNTIGEQLDRNSPNQN